MRQTTGFCVLVVENDLASFDSLKLLLQKCDYNVTTVSNASRALELVMENKGKFDVLIADIDTPGMDGPFQLLESLGELLPAILLSAMADQDLIKRALIKGACHWFAKPVRLEDLKNIPRYIMQRKQSCDYTVQRNPDNLPLNSEDKHAEPASMDQNARSDRKRENLNDGEAREDGKDEDNVDPVRQKKPRLVWDDRLKRKFVDVVEKLGTHNATPKNILRLMNEPGLSRENIASHLQKYRISLRKEEAKNSQQGHMSAVLGKVTTISGQANAPIIPGGGDKGHFIVGPNHSCGSTRMSLMQHGMIGSPDCLPSLNMPPGITSVVGDHHLVYPQNLRTFHDEPSNNSHPLMFPTALDQAIHKTQPPLSNEANYSRQFINDCSRMDLSGMSYGSPLANPNLAQIQDHQVPSQVDIARMQIENNMTIPFGQMQDLVPSEQEGLSRMKFEMPMHSGSCPPSNYCDPPPPLCTPRTPGVELPLKPELQYESIPNDAGSLNEGSYHPNDIGHSFDQLIFNLLEQGNMNLDDCFNFPPYEGLGIENGFSVETLGDVRTNNDNLHPRQLVNRKIRQLQ